MTLRFAGPMHDGNFKMLSTAAEPRDFFGSDAMEYPYLCKFKDRLTPAQMRHDIVFRKSGDRQEPVPRARCEMVKQRAPHRLPVTN